MFVRFFSFYNSTEKTGLTMKRQTTIIVSYTLIFALMNSHRRISWDCRETIINDWFAPKVNWKYKIWPSLGLLLRYAYMNNKDNYNIDDVSIFLWTLSHLCIEFLVLSEEVNTKLGQPDEILQLPGGRDHHLTYHLLSLGIGSVSWNVGQWEGKWEGEEEAYLLTWPPPIISHN